MTPTLRFPEFVNDWTVVELGRLARIYQPETLSQADLDPNGKYLVYGANGIIGRLDRFNHEQSQVAVTCRGSTCGEITLTQPKSWITGNSMVINLDQNPNVSKIFIFNKLAATNWRYLITGSGQPQITGDIKKHRVAIPTYPEQEKIATFLGAIDARIGLLQRRRAALERYKKGMMQRLFAQTLRFKREDGTAFPDWAKRTLGSVFDWVGTNSLSRDMLTEEPGPVQNIHYGDIHGRFAARSRVRTR